jgi:hypothetical protein
MVLISQHENACFEGCNVMTSDFKSISLLFYAVLTHLKTLDETHSPFFMYANRNYREAFFVSIRNFLNVIYHRTWTISEVCPKNQYAIEIMDDFFSIAQPK